MNYAKCALVPVLVLTLFSGFTSAAEKKINPKQALEAAKRDLTSFLEGKEAVPLRKLPATKDGVQVYLNPQEKGKRLDKVSGLDLDDYDSHLEDKGIGLEPGEKATITRVVIAGNMVEVHLDGGGLGRRGSGNVNKKAPGRDRQGGSRVNFRYNRKIAADDLSPVKFVEFASRILDMSALRFELAKTRLDPEIRKALESGQVKVGMTGEMVGKILPKPTKIELPDMKADPDVPYLEVRHYEVDGMPLVVWFKNGVVTAVRDFKTTAAN